MLAPTGTIGFMMDCDTTGIEPDLALVKYKKLVGGGVIKIVNNTVPQALMKLGYTPEQTDEIVALHRPATARSKARPGSSRSICRCSIARLRRWTAGARSPGTGHVKMMAAAQPFLSGAISKTINMPEESTVEDIMQAYIEVWKLGLKAVAIYRDNSKAFAAAVRCRRRRKDEKKAARRGAKLRARRAGRRSSRNSSPARNAASCRASAAPSRTSSRLAGTKATSPWACTTTATPGEIFIKMAKEGSTLSGLMDGFALTFSIGLQYGVPLKALVDKLVNTRFEPSGWTGNPAIPYAKSILDYLARWLGGRFISADYLQSNGEIAVASAPAVFVEPAPTSAPPPAAAASQQRTSPATKADSSVICGTCGMLMTPNGSCYKCENCGGTSGCS